MEKDIDVYPFYVFLCILYMYGLIPDLFCSV